MRKDIYIVSVTHRLTNDTRISEEGYDTIEEAIYFIEHRSDEPRKEPYVLTWLSPDYIYEIHLIKVGD